MEKADQIAATIAARAFATLTMEDLERIYHVEADRMIEAGLHQQQFDVMEPLMEYHIDGIDEAADDENQTHLKILVSKAIVQMQQYTMRGDVDAAQA